MSVAATPDLRYIVGGCMDECVHIWHLSQPGKDGAAGAAQRAEGDDDDDDAATELVEYSCGGYQVMRPGSSSSGSSLSAPPGLRRPALMLWLLRRQRAAHSDKHRGGDGRPSLMRAGQSDARELQR